MSQPFFLSLIDVVTKFIIVIVIPEMGENNLLPVLGGLDSGGDGQRTRSTPDAFRIAVTISLCARTTRAGAPAAHLPGPA